jgi:hypothetical protein
MPSAKGHLIRIVSHGPSCFDGVVAAATVARFYQGHRVVPMFVANGESDEKIQRLKLKMGGNEEELWITDLSWNSNATAEHLRSMAAGCVSGTRENCAALMRAGLNTTCR